MPSFVKETAELSQGSLIQDNFLTIYLLGADFISAGVKLATYILCLGLIWSCKKAGRVTSSVQFLFWLLLAICQGFTFGSVVNHQLVGLSWSRPNEIIVILSWTLILINFLVYCFPDYGPAYTDLKGKYIVFTFLI